LLALYANNFYFRRSLFRRRCDASN
jgi:hypothetical protein